MNKFFNYIILAFILLFSFQLSAQNNSVPKPLYDDPVYHGAADPVIIYNKAKKKWWMLYTNRRASIEGFNRAMGSWHTNRYCRKQRWY